MKRKGTSKGNSKGNSKGTSKGASKMKRPALLVLAGIAGLGACGGPAAAPAGPAPGAAVAAARGAPVTPAPVAAPDPALAPLPLWPEVRRARLPNGLTYYLMKNKKPERRVLLWLAVNAGSVQEDADQRGLAHFVEHMAFNGTARFPKRAIIDYIEHAGMRFGADLNAYTSYDETVYTLEVPADDPAHLDRGLDILRDWAGAVAFDPKEIDLERGVVLEEWRLGRGAGRRLSDKHQATLYRGTRYAERLPIGLPEIVKGAPPAALVRYYRDWYRPEHMAVIVVGDFEDGAAIERLIGAKLGDLRAPAAPRARPRGGVPRADGTRVSIEVDKEQVAQTVSITNMLAHRPEASAADYRRGVLEEVYSRIFNERLRTLARRRDAPFVGAAASMSGGLRDIDGFRRTATVKGGRVEDALRSVLAEVLRIEQHGFTQAELDRAREAIARGRDRAVDEAPTARSRDHAEEMVRNFLEGELMIGRAAERDLTREILPRITLAELNGLARGYGGAESRAIVISGPDGKPLPTREQVLAIADEVGAARLEPWVERPPPRALLAAAPRRGAIAKERQLPEVGVTEWTLSNGVRVLVKPTAFDADGVLLRGSSPGGLAVASAAQYPHARFADDIAALGGVGELDAEDLGKALVGKRASAAASIGAVTESITGSASARDVETMLQLVHLRMTAPRKDEDAIGVWREGLAESLADRERSPDYQMAIKSGEVLWQGHPRRAPVRPADVQRVDADQALAFYRDRFGDASDFVFVIVGAVDLAALRPLVETYLASLPAKGRIEKERDDGARRVGGAVKRSWRLGQEPKARVSIQYLGDEPWTREKERDLFVLGRVLAIRLREVLREDLGGVYGVGAGGSLVRSPHQERVFAVSFGADPARLDELLAAARREIAAIQKEGAKEDHLDRVRKGFERERELQLKSNSFWAGWLETAARYGDDPRIVLDPAPMLARMTSRNVQAAARRFLDERRYYQAIMLPADAPAAAPAAPTTSAVPAPAAQPVPPTTPAPAPAPR